MSGGANNDERFEQIGHSWLKHAFFALEDNACSLGWQYQWLRHRQPSLPGMLRPVRLQPECGPIRASVRAPWVNPFTGAFPSSCERSTTRHVHDGVIAPDYGVEVSDLNTAENPGATYFAEARYVTPHEYAWCQAHPGECNMYQQRSPIVGLASPALTASHFRRSARPCACSLPSRPGQVRAQQ